MSCHYGPLFSLASSITRATDYPFNDLIGTIQFIDYPRRKVILKACRIQGPFSVTSRFYKRHSSVLNTTIRHPQPVRNRWVLDQRSPSTTLWEFIQTHHTLLSTPTLAGFLSMLVRFLPYDSLESVEEAKRQSIAKELHASQNPVPLANLNWYPLFITHSGPIPEYHKDIPHNPDIIREIGTSLRSHLNLFSKFHHLVLPTTSRKKFKAPCYSLGPYEQFNDHSPIESLLDAERVYANSGIQLEGPTEAGLVVMGNTGGPRTFYKRGLTHHWPSRYIQPFLSWLVDSLHTTHRRKRFHLFSLPELTAEMIVMIYDYASFTSHLQELRKFIEVLANVFKGRRFQVLDGFLGPIWVDLGDLLLDYNKTCNFEAEFDASAVLGVVDAILNHGAGMLGIPGNITACTLLHGIHLIIILASLSMGKVIGDDAIGLFVEGPGWTKIDMKAAICLIGDIAEEKFEEWVASAGNFFGEMLDERWTYEKRPFNRCGDHVWKGELMVWPGLDNAFGIQSNAFTVPAKQKPSSSRTYISQHTRFLSRLPSTLTSLEESLIRSFSATAYRYHGVDLYGGFEWSFGYLCPPYFQLEFDYEEYLRVFASEGGVICIPDPFLEVSAVDVMDVGGQFTAMPNGVLTYAKKMGWIADDTPRKNYLVSDLMAFDRSLSDFVFGTRRFPKLYTILTSLPIWLVSYVPNPD